MAKFMNAELIAIRDSLTCGHCGCTFKGSDSQAWKVKYEKRVVYCSDICRTVGVSKKRTKPIPNYGPCPTCKQPFFSKTSKIYCSMNCYKNSEQFKEVIKSAVEKSKSREAKEKLQKTLESKPESGPMIVTTQCLECNCDIHRKRYKRVKKYCSMVCYRAYMAKRFDRWVANPEGLALPQCYDEFLDKEKLPCIIENCTWSGKFLSLHINQAHGIQASDFKRAAGFNLKSGIVSKPLAKIMQERGSHGLAKMTKEEILAYRSKRNQDNKEKGNYIRYRSLESKEHRVKARAVMTLEAELGVVNGPERVCQGCGVTFQQKYKAGRKLFCTTDCRDDTYAKRLKSTTPRVRDKQGKFLPKPKGV